MCLESGRSNGLSGCNYLDLVAFLYAGFSMGIIRGERSASSELKLTVSFPSVVLPTTGLR